MTTIFQNGGFFTLFLDGGDFSKNLMTSASCNGPDPANASNILVNYQSLLFSIPLTNIKFQMGALEYAILGLIPVDTYTEYNTTAAFIALYSGYLTNA
jgi:hypothetical protein